MFIGDEYAVVSAVVDALPTPLRNRLLLIVPGAMERIRRSPERAAAGAALGKGQLFRRLEALGSGAIESIMDPDPALVRVLEYKELAAGMIAAKKEAADRGISLPPMSPQYIAAARLFQVPIWVGYDANVPRWALTGVEFSGVQWHRMSELDEGFGPRQARRSDTERTLFD